MKLVITAIIIFIFCFLIYHYKYRDRRFQLFTFMTLSMMVGVVNDSTETWGVFLLFIILLSTGSHFKLKDLSPCVIYVVFVLWCAITLSYSKDLSSGIMMVVKFIYPLFFYYLTYKVLKNSKILYTYQRKIIQMIVPFILLGIFAKFFGRFSTCQVYYGMEICLIPLSFFVLSHKKKYIIYVGLCAVPALVLTKRTPLLGIAVGCIIFLFLIYKFKAVLPTFIAIVLGIILVFSIPQFKEKLFYNGSVTLEDVLRGQSDVEDQFNTNGRDVFWPYLLATFYHNNKLIGVGSGTVKGFVQSVNNDYAANFQLVHNDWLTILCENGLIGVIIMGIFFLQVLISCIKYSSKKYPLELRVIAASCAGSLFCTGIHMYFENCVNSFIFTIFFIFYAVFIRAKQNYEKGKLNK